MAITRELLASGNVLVSLIVQLHNNNVPGNFYSALNCLRDSVLLVPVPLRHAKSGAGDPGRLFTAGQVREMNPDILTARDRETRLLPVFAQIKQLPPDYRKRFTVAAMEFIEIMDLAEETGTDGIVVDPFSVPLNVSRDLYGFIRSLPSRLEPEAGGEDGSNEE